MANVKKIKVNGTIYDLIVDLSNYYNKTEVDTAISTAISNIVDGEEEEF